jgi:glyoxylase-like metal-dependent hydrolase (beta-lactamase superfamily II)
MALSAMLNITPQCTTFIDEEEGGIMAATFIQLAEGVHALVGDKDPNAGVVIGDDSVMVVDARATPALAHELIDAIRTVTDKPIHSVVLTHYHATRTLGAPAYGADLVIASQATYELIAERGMPDYKWEVARFPHLFQSAEAILGLTWPTATFGDHMRLWLGVREARIDQIGRGHTRGDTVVFVPDRKVLLASDLVGQDATPYCGDAYIPDWIATLDRLRAYGADKMLPGRGDPLNNPAEVESALGATQRFLETLWTVASDGAAAGQPLNQVYDTALTRMTPEFGAWSHFELFMPYNVSRAYDEARGIADPPVWTPERDQQLRQELVK